MNYYVELQKNTQKTNCVKQIKEFNTIKEADEYFKNILLEIDPEDKGFVVLGEIKFYYQFYYCGQAYSTRIERNDIKKINFFIQDFLSKGFYFSLKVDKLKIQITKITF